MKRIKMLVLYSCILFMVYGIYSPIKTFAKPFEVSRETILKKRIIPLYTSFTDILILLGAEQYIVAKTTLEKREQFYDIPTVGTYIHPNVEKIIAYLPSEVLFVKGRPEVEKQMRFLEERGIKTIALEMDSFENLYTALRVLSKLVGKEEYAEQYIAEQKKRIDAITRCVAKQKRPRVFVELRYPHLLTAGKKSIVAEIIQLAGGEYPISISKKTVRWSQEALLGVQPDVYIQQQGAMNPILQDVTKDPLFQHNNAYKNNAIFRIYNGELSRLSLHSVDVLQQVATWLHVEAMKLCLQKEKEAS